MFSGLIMVLSINILMKKKNKKVLPSNLELISAPVIEDLQRFKP